MTGDQPLSSSPSLKTSSSQEPLLPPSPQPPLNLPLILLISTLTIGSHYSKHSLTSLSPEIIPLLNTNRTEYALLFSSQQLPGILLPILGGLALTYVPLPPTAVLFTTCITLSTALCAVAVTRRSYTLLLLARLIFGLCDGALVTLQGALVAHSFPGRVGAGYGAMLCVSRLSSFTGLTLPAFLSSAVSLDFSMWASAMVCVPPLISSIIYAYTHPWHTTTNSETRRQPPSLASLHRVFTSLTAPFWLVSTLWATIASAVFSLTHFLPDIMTQHFGLSAVRSGFLSGSLLLAAAITSPIFGIYQDRVGKRATVMTLCCALLTTGFLLCATAVTATPFVHVPHYLFYVGLGLIALSFCVAPVTLLACVAVVVPDPVVPAALGFYKALENAVLAVTHLAVGVARDWSGQYTLSLLLLTAICLSALAVAFFLTGKQSLQEHSPSPQRLVTSPNV